MWYALINTLGQDDRYYGQVISRHSTYDRACGAEESLQKTVTRINGPGAYIPTMIKGVDGAHSRKHTWLSYDDVQTPPEEDY